MAETTNWAFPENLQPKSEDVRFDLEAALDSVVLLRAEIPEDAFTASILGTERAGNGVVIREDGLILTIGYLITEAQTLWLTTNSGVAVAGHPLAYDQATGFGLVQPLGRLKAPALQRGSTKGCAVGDDVIVIGHGGRSHALSAKIIAKREFAGYWEYVLDEALFTAPAHPEWAGAALVGEDGKLLGIGSLLVQESVEGETVQGNMIVPIDPLAPILDDMLMLGRANRPPRAWLGMYTTEANGQLVVAGLADGGPADVAGVRPGDFVLEVAQERVSTLPELFRKVWHLGPAGTEIPVTVARDGAPVRVRIRSADRNDFLKKPQLH
ncbi:MAG TPA: S1C family serine protease [Burkholderiales bacterium]|nr:S1C family serine protease [Burkholderiales bacterium]